MNHFMAEVCWIKRSQQECSRWVLHSILRLCQFYFYAWVIRKKYVELVRHTNLCIHNSESYMFLWVVPLQLYSDLHLSIDSQGYVCDRVYRCLLFLWPVKPFQSEMTRRNKLQYLIHIQDWDKVVVFRKSKCQSSFCSVLPRSITPFMSGLSWELHHSLWILDVVILLAIIVHFSVPVLSQPECRQVNHDMWNQYS